MITMPEPTLDGRELVLGETRLPLPKLAQAVTVHVWAVPAAYRETGYFVSMQDDGHPMEVPACAAVDATYLGSLPMEADAETARAAALAEARDQAVAVIDGEAESRRLLVLTPGAGQMAAYQAKEAQAVALLEDESPTEAAYPDIYNEVGITADTAGGVADVIMQAAAAWRVYGRQIERTRLAAKKQIAEAGTPDAVAAILAGIVWPAA